MRILNGVALAAVAGVAVWVGAGSPVWGQGKDQPKGPVASKTKFAEKATKDAPAPVGPLAAVAANYKNVTTARLLNPEPDNWLMIRGTYDGWGYSKLKQINRNNVKNLKPMWVFSTGDVRVHESAPVVNGAALFITTSGGQVIALDATTGNLLWRYRKARAAGAIVPHDVNRGVALYGDKVYYASGDAALVALDAKTGRVVWTAQVEDNSSAHYMSLAPMVADGKVLVGTSGGEYGVRGFVSAFDAETGKPLWRTYTIPAEGEPGHQTWPAGDAWKSGGAPVWVTGNYDPATNISYWGTGNGGPTVGDVRPGDNLYTTSVLAIDVGTGKLVGYHQYHPNDSWDWDEVSPPLLIDFQRNGRTVKGLINAGRSGYLWWMDRAAKGPSIEQGGTGSIGFVSGKPYVYQNVFKSIDPVTGRPDVDPEHKPLTGTAKEFCPAGPGAKNWPPAAYNPDTRLMYVPANNNLCGSFQGTMVAYVRGKGFVGVGNSKAGMVAGATHFGEVQAWNVDSGEMKWMVPFEKSPNWGGLLTTAGGLVFGGGTVDRKLRAYDAENGKILWEFPTNSGIETPPTTFTVNGKQYIAALSGWGGDAAGVQNRLNQLFPGEFPPVPDGGSLWVFALE